jgi:xylitol oxidase
MAVLTNWAGNITFSTDVLHQPASLVELQALVAANEQVRVLGSGHSFNLIADTDQALVSIRGLPPVIELDTLNARVRVGGGVRYGELTGVLDRAGFALPNLGSLPHISVAGACATGTHGSGTSNQVLAAAVQGQTLVMADGEIVELGPATQDFAGSVIGLGSLGVVTDLTLGLVPAFEIRQYVYDGLSFGALTENFAAITETAYSFSIFTDWQSACQVWLKSRTERAAGDFFDAQPADGQRHPIPGEDGSTATEQFGVPGPWQARLPHFRLEFTPSNGEEIQSEYFVARADALAAIEAVHSMGDQLAPVLQVSEIRAIAADELWISPCYQQDRVALHFTWVRDQPAVEPVVRELEARLAPFSAVPHWGKYFHLTPACLAELHPRLADFAQLVRRYDPSGVFANDFIRTFVLG